MQKITPFLWYSKEAEEAAAFYASIFPDSRVVRVTALPSESPSGPPGSVKVVEFVLFGQPFVAMSAGPLDPFNHAVSFVVNCDDQAEVDRYWNALLKGGAAEQCGWLKDRYGLSWQIVPDALPRLLSDPDRGRARGGTAPAVLAGPGRGAGGGDESPGLHRPASPWLGDRSGRLCARGRASAAAGHRGHRPSAAARVHGHAAKRRRLLPRSRRQPDRTLGAAAKPDALTRDIQGPFLELVSRT